jgi:ABC-type branched-subunit amino acid transport system substrate-binding protein
MKHTFKILFLAAMATIASLATAGSQELRILNPSPLSGLTADTGKAQAEAIEKSLYYLSKDSNIKVVYKSVDDQFKKEVAIKVIPEEIQKFKPDAIVGVFGTPNVQLLVKEQIFDNSKIPMIGSRTGAADGVFSEYTHHIRASFGDEIGGYLRYYSLNNKKACVFHVASSFGEEGVKAVQKSISERATQGDKIAFDKASHAPNTVAVEEGIQTLMSKNCDLIVMQTTTAPAKAALLEIKRIYDQKYGEKTKLELGDARPSLSVLMISSIDPAALDYKKAVSESDRIWLSFTSVVPNNADEFSNTASFLTDYRNFLKEEKLTDSTTVKEGFLIAKITIEAAKKVKGDITGQKLQEQLKTLKVRIGSGMVLDMSKPRASNRVFYQFYDKTSQKLVDM